ncbi:hypothetical protein [Desulfobulbus elongatus]|uniref:hypothetical protein n=1 Tax=Desulfobulbus elongatus TaxID=53332 RepID=UPI0004846DED|nr:hypothetical protein [Desulfobulbus elongatus]
MKKRLLLGFVLLAATLTGCGAPTINPNYSSANPELMFIGSEAPADKPTETLNLGSYCLSVSEKWKKDGKTPDGQTIWTKDSFRRVVPCR